MELVLGSRRVAQLERKLHLDRAAKPDRAQAKEEGERLRQWHLCGEQLLERHLARLRDDARRHFYPRGWHLSVALVEDNLLTVHIFGEPRHRVGGGHLGSHLGARDAWEGHKGRAVGGQGDEGVGGLSVKAGRIVEVKRRNGHAVNNSVAQPKR
eukprot:scaffold76652_cov31-Tisochrysis_lutea.AAC.4